MVHFHWTLQIVQRNRRLIFVLTFLNSSQKPRLFLLSVNFLRSLIRSFIWLSTSSQLTIVLFLPVARRFRLWLFERVWEGIIKLTADLNYWIFLRKLSKVTSQVDVVLWSMIERTCHESCDYLATSLTFLLYLLVEGKNCNKREVIILSVKVLKLLKIHFREKIQHGYRLLVCVWVGIQRVKFLIINLHLPLPSTGRGGGASKLAKDEATLLSVKNWP